MNCHIVENRKAAKEHRCNECRGVISKGEIHVVHSGVFDGDPYRERQCVDCAPLFDKINKLYWKNGDEGLIFGELYDAILQSRDPQEIAHYLGIMAKRKARIHSSLWKCWDEAMKRNRTCT